jgi:hypothetical protein
MSWKRIPVRIRHENDEESRPLGECSSTSLDELPDLVLRWGYEGEVAAVSGQFTRDGFEIIIHESADS